MIKEILLPNLGEGVDTADVSDILVKAGDSIVKDGPFIVLESEKATMEIPSDFSGKVEKVLVAIGDKVSTGEKLISINTTDGDDKPAIKGKIKKPTKSNGKVEEKAETKVSTPHPTKQATIEPKKNNQVPFASPAVRRFARELGADLKLVQGSGAKGRIVKEDVQSFIKAQLTGQQNARRAPQPTIDFTQWGDVETVPLNKIRRITGDRMTTAWQTVPQVTNFDKIDITELDILRRSLQNVNGKMKQK